MSKELKALESLGGTRSHQAHSGSATSDAPDVATQRAIAVPDTLYYPSNPVASVEPTTLDSALRYGQTRSSTVSSPSTTRSLGVHSILNPAQPGPIAAEPSTSSPSFSARAGELSGVSVASPISPRNRKRNQRALQLDESAPNIRGTAPRRSLTPTSPGRRLESLGSRRSFTGPSSGPSAASFTQATGRIYTAEPGLYHDSDVPPLPPTQRGQSQPRATQTANDVTGPTVGLEGPYARVRQNRSPDTPEPLYGYLRRPSSGFPYGAAAATQQSYQSLQPAPSGGSYPGVPITRASEGSQYADVGPGSLQMTLNTEQGTMLVPVDVQQASRTANEKRKRNACASARFRARRKEKEKEASHTIVSLEREMRDLADECDHYRKERDFFRELVTRYIDPSQLSPRPPSPRPRRTSYLSSTSNDADLAPFQDQYREASEPPGPPPLRQRTGDAVRLSGAPFSLSPMLPPQARFSSQPPVPPGGLPPMPLPPSLPNPFADARVTPPGMPPPPPPLARSQSYDPFRPDRFDRNWDPGR